MNEPVIGIDLGTTNSEVAVCINGKIEIIGENDNPMLPSVVGISPDGKLIIGSEARNQYALYPEKTLKSIKRKMGSDEKVSLGEKEYLPQEISAMILRKLKENAEKRLKQKVSKAVITVPALFNDAQRQATRDAGKIAGLEVLRIINEPTAACLAYENKDVDKAKYVLAFDLGGGTFDVSLVKVEDDVTEVIVSHGDNHLGGDDFDQVISEWLQQAIYDEQKSPNKLSKLAEYRLDKAAEAAKMQLSESAYANIIENNLTSESTKSLSLEKELSVSKFNELIQPFVSKTVLAVRQCLADAKMKPAEIDEIILVGGSTRSSIIKDTIEKEFGVRPRNDINPDLAVVYGAAIMAARLMGEEDHRILVDITPYTFGVSCMGELNGETSPFRFAPIIKAGSPLPINKEEIFYTMYDNQETVEVRVFQGENEDARK
ncbi:MAG: Hsp70 family protein, partial [Victivallaceae bacterium]|nr:Hsp70 family protein [Victivallaceae bacterium]